MNTQTMLDNISQMTLYSYSFRENAFNSNEISNKREEVGLLAQEVEIILPDAVQKMVSAVFSKLLDGHCHCASNFTSYRIFKVEMMFDC